MSANSKKLFPNAVTFSILILSWWAIGMIVSREAVKNDGRFFDANSLLLAGAYYNDWLPVITALALALGWGVGFFVVSLNKTYSRSITFNVLFLIFGVPVLCFVAIIGIRNSSPAFANDFVEPSFILFLSGNIYGMCFGLVRRFEKASND